jgi:hypothetical protein
MSDIYKTGSDGEQSLSRYLTARGRSVRPSDIKTFDLVVDGVYAEVKSSKGPYSKLGFIGLTDNQLRALQDGTDFTLFLVCNLAKPDDLEVIEIRGQDLRREPHKTECHHYWYRPQLERIRHASGSA